MEVLKRLAPNYWAGYYAVYIALFAYLAFVFREPLGNWPQTESLFVAAALFAVSTGGALMAAAITEGVGYVVLLIPRRIKQIKEEGIAEGLARGRERTEKEVAKGRKEAFEEGFRAGSEGRKPQTGDEDIERLKRLMALYDSGDITAEEVGAILSRRYNGGGESD